MVSSEAQAVQPGIQTRVKGALKCRYVDRSTDAVTLGAPCLVLWVPDKSGSAQCSSVHRPANVEVVASVREQHRDTVDVTPGCGGNTPAFSFFAK